MDDMPAIRRAIFRDGAKPAVVNRHLVGLIIEPDFGLPREAKIGGYQGDAEYLCINCVRETFAVGDESAEEALTRVAAERGIDRSDERNYDSSELPKPLRPGEIVRPEICGGCLTLFGPDPAEFRCCPDEDCRDWVTGASGPGECCNCGATYDDADFEEEEN
jgi:hypothetical protein